MDLGSSVADARRHATNKIVFRYFLPILRLVGCFEVVGYWVRADPMGQANRIQPTISMLRWSDRTSRIGISTVLLK